MCIFMHCILKYFVFFVVANSTHPLKPLMWKKCIWWFIINYKEKVYLFIKNITEKVKKPLKKSGNREHDMIEVGKGGVRWGDGSLAEGSLIILLVLTLESQLFLWSLGKEKDWEKSEAGGGEKNRWESLYKHVSRRPKKAEECRSPANRINQASSKRNGPLFKVQTREIHILSCPNLFLCFHHLHYICEAV